MSSSSEKIFEGDANPTVSVIIPTYNRGDLIATAIDSVLQQTIADQVEIIVVDDGSTDDTVTKVRAYGGRVRYVFTPNGGAAHARNVGMRQARGRYLTFLDSDDAYYPYTLELQSRLLDRYTDLGLLYAEMSAFDDSGFFDRYHLKTYHSSAYRDPRMTYERMFATSATLGETGTAPESLASRDPETLNRRVYFGNIFDAYLIRLVLFTNSVMLRRAVASEAGERNEHIKYWEEMDYMLGITRNHRLCFVDVPTYKLRYHDGQISTTARQDGRYIWIRKQQILLRVLKRRALDDRDYYSRHRLRLDRHIAHLHRAVAIPLLLFPGGTPSTRRRYVRTARKYLARCRKYGQSELLLLMLSYAPGPLRRLGVTVFEKIRGVAAGLARGPVLSSPSTRKA